MTTDQLIIDCERLRFALHGCLVAARNGKRDICVYSDAKGIAMTQFKYIENEAEKALYGGKEVEENGD